MDFENIALLAGAFGIGIGFGLQSIVNNFLSGLILIFERPIQVGDTIEFQGANGPQLGKVKRIGIRASIVRSLDGAEIIIPNANLVSNDVTNWTKSDQLRRVEVKVGVAYGSDPDEVLALLLRVAENHPEILKRPEPVALFMEFGDSSLNFSLRGWTPDFDNYLVLRSQLTVEVFRALKKAEITIPFPQQDVHIKTDERKQD
ncbi:MAG: mechanosensitive ion channel [Bacteroidetes bacterium]|nr:MAG: mechanosensitive ion channel [Bacteroidota bacterium]